MISTVAPTLNQSILEKQQSGVAEREKTERKNTLKACMPYLVLAQLSKQINVCHMTYSRLFPRVREMQRVLVTGLETELTLQNDANRAVCLQDN